ncbi:MAG: hypothetical protein ACC645_07775, partial [Pirellulales bacterium]
MKRERYAQVRQIFLEASRLEGEERERFLKEACGEDASLRGEVVSLMEYDDDHTLLKETPAYEGRATTPPAVSAMGNLASVRRFLQGRRDSSFETTPKLLAERRRLALVSLVAALLLMLLGYWVYSGINTSLRTMRANKLQALLNNQVLALQFWIKEEKAKVESWARNRTLMDDVEQLLQIDADATEARDLYAQAPQRERIKDLLQATADHDLTYAVWDR